MVVWVLWYMARYGPRFVAWVVSRSVLWSVALDVAQYADQLAAQSMALHVVCLEVIA